MNTPEITYLNRIIEQQPSNVTAYLRRALLFIDHDTALALKDFDTAINLDPKCAEAYANRGLLNDRIKKEDLALQDYEKALSFDSQLPEVYFNRGLLWSRRHDYEKAAVDLEQAVLLNPDYYSALSELARALINTDSYIRAIEITSKAIQLTPTAGSNYYYRAVAYDRLAEIVKAKQDLQTALALSLRPSHKADAERLFARLKDF